LTALGVSFGSQSQAVDALVVAIRDDVIKEVKADLGGEIVDKVIKVVVSQLANLPTPQLSVSPSITVLPAEIPKQDRPEVFVTNNVDMDDLAEALAKNTEAMNELARVMLLPVRREVFRNDDKLIVSMTESRM
jgi:hypothetical protein